MPLARSSTRHRCCRSLVGTAWGVSVSAHLDIYLFVLALLATVCVHAASNVLNDVGDETIGTDRRNEQRIYPYTGGSRFIQLGILSQSRMARLGVSLLAVAALLGLALIVEKGPVVLLFGLAGVALAVLYSLGPIKLSAIGLGELSVAAAIGVLPVTGAAWLQGAPIDSALLLFSLPVSAWVAAILFINEVPDIEADGASGKNTLPVRLGLSASSRLYLAIQATAAIVVVVLTWQGQLPLLAPLVPLGSAGAGLARVDRYKDRHCRPRRDDAGNRIDVGHTHDRLLVAHRLRVVFHLVVTRQTDHDAIQDQEGTRHPAGRGARAGHFSGRRR